MGVRDIPGVVLTLVIFGMIAGVGALVLADVKTQEAPSTCYNATEGACNTGSRFNDTVDEAISGISELSSWMETIALVIAAVIIIALVLLFRSKKM